MVAVSELAGGPAGAPGCADSVTVSTEASRQQLRSQHVAWRQHSNIYTVAGGYEADSHVSEYVSYSHLSAPRYRWATDLARVAKMHPLRCPMSGAALQGSGV